MYFFEKISFLKTKGEIFCVFVCGSPSAGTERPRTVKFGTHIHILIDLHWPDGSPDLMPICVVAPKGRPSLLIRETPQILIPGF